MFSEIKETIEAYKARDPAARSAMEVMLLYPGVSAVHDLHVWALASRTPAMTAHVVVADGSDPAVVRQELAGLLARHGVSHVTLQMERPGEAACAGGRCGHP